MRWGRVALGALGVLGMAACFANLEGFTNGPADAGPDGAVVDSGVADVAADAVADADASATEGGAPFVLVSSDGMGLGNVDAGVVSTSQLVEKGDFLIIGCDLDGRAGNVTVTLPEGTATLTPIGPIRSPAGAAQGGLEVELFTGVVDQVPSGGIIKMAAVSDNGSPFIDCTLNVYRGGRIGVQAVVDQKARTGTGPGRTQCGPVSTVPGGVAFYEAVRYDCSGKPAQKFTEQHYLQGNPTGEWLPTDGTTAETELGDCENSTGDWVCLTVSVSP